MKFSKIKFIVIEPCDFVSFPAGGQMNFARLLLRLYRDEIATVGYTMSYHEPVGVWFRKESDGFIRDHFNLAYLPKIRTRYLMPGRLRAFFQYLRYRKRIHSHPCKRYFLQEHAILMAFDRRLAESVCYRFPGVESQLTKSRFKWAIPLAKLFDFLFYRATRKADVLLASADEDAIAEMRRKSFGYVAERKVTLFPTRVDTTVFRKKEVLERQNPLRLVSCGRLHWVKGWDLILDSLALLKNELDFSYTYIGDGPDREVFENHANRVGIGDRVELAGFLAPVEIAQRLRTSDLYLMGSHMEGWPTSLVEAYVTGLPMVTTKISGARIIVKDGVNGFVCNDRDPRKFADRILQTLALDPDHVATAAQPARFSIGGLAADLEDAWF